MAAVADGLFAEYELDVEILDPVPRAANVRRVAAGGAEFCLTSVHHYLTARSETAGLPVRFGAIIGQRHTIGALVTANSEIVRPADLAGRRVGGKPGAPLLIALQTALEHLGVEPLEVIPVEEPAFALGTREVDVIAATVDTLRRNQRQAKVDLAAIPLRLEVYMSGLLAADNVPLELVARMRAALVASLEQQREDPDRGLAEMLHRYPDLHAEDARAGWAALENYIFTEVRPGSMEPERWRSTLAVAHSAFDLPLPDPETVYRPELTGDLVDA